MLSTGILIGLTLAFDAHASATRATQRRQPNAVHRMDENIFEQRAPFCTTQNISTMNVSACDCRPWGQGCSTSCVNESCDIPSVNKSVNSCTEGCTDREGGCQGCGLWFTEVCRCIKSRKCTATGTIKPDASPVWLLMEPTSADQDTLISTNELLPGIVETSRHNSAQHDLGWVFAQKHYDSSSQALAINPYRVRTQEQVHIHVCKKRNATTVDMLSKAKIPSSGHLTKMPQDSNLYCLALGNGAPLTSFATTLGAFFDERPQDCWARIGAGIIRDDNNNTWGCATNNTKGPLEYFC